MFIKFSKSKANYKKGQVFPIMIATVASMIIMAMITANLGKLSIFKTDVSNAADAGALAGASVLSGTLLGFGLASDMECGKSVVTTARMLEIFVLGRDDLNISLLNDSSGPGGSTTSTQTLDDGSTITTTTTRNSNNSVTTSTTSTNTDGSEGPSSSSTDNSQSYDQFPNDIVASVKIMIMRLVNFLPDYIKAMLDGQMAWANAKQTALRFAFQNAGVDERPPVKFKDYCGVSGKDPSLCSYDDYINNFLAQEANQSGFSRFMSHPLSGFWRDNTDGNNNYIGSINPDMDLVPLIITSGYGWSQEPDTSFSSSYPGNNYKAKDNYVEVQVNGSILYSLESLTFSQYFGSDVATTLAAIVGIGSYLKYIEKDDTVTALEDAYGLGFLLAAVYCAVSAAAFRGMIEYLPVGFTFTDQDIKKETTDNPITVQVTRHKKNSNLGMWNFQYGDVVAKSAAHAFQQAPAKSGYSASDITIEPVLMAGMKDLGSFLGQYASAIDPMSFLNPFTIGSMVVNMLCMGAVGTMGFLTGGWVGLILMYIISTQLCSAANRLFQPQKGDASFNNALGNDDEPNNWFTTSLHLFETELVSGFLQ